MKPTCLRKTKTHYGMFYGTLWAFHLYLPRSSPSINVLCSLLLLWFDCSTQIRADTAPASTLKPLADIGLVSLRRIIAVTRPFPPSLSVTEPIDADLRSTPAPVTTGFRWKEMIHQWTRAMTNCLLQNHLLMCLVCSKLLRKLFFF